MSFDLKNAEATYQCLMDKVFCHQIERCMEVYIDDMVVCRSLEDHVKDHAEVFGQVRKYGMRLNPAKCTFEVLAGKFLSFMLMSRGIKANLDRVVLEMRSPHNLKEVQRLVGRLTLLFRFIPRLVEHIKPTMKVMKKSVETSWDD